MFLPQHSSLAALSMEATLFRRAMPTPVENRESEVVAVVAVFLFLSALALAARFESKRMVRKPLRIDDYLLIVAWLMTVAEAGAIIWAAKYTGLGRHKKDIDLEMVIGYEKVFFFGSVIQPLLLGIAKVSVLIFLRRIFITKWFRWTTHILMAMTICWAVGDSLGGALICQPVRSSWDPTMPNNCGNRYLLNVIGPLPWIITDFMILICPFPMVWKLQTSTRHKVALGGLFLVGSLTCIVSCVRYSFTFFILKDPTWDAVPLWYWNIIEAGVTVICACLFASKPVVMRLVPDKLMAKIKSKSFSRSTSKNKPNMWLNHRSRPSGGSLESSETEEIPRMLTTQRSADQAVRYEMEHYRDPNFALGTFFDNSEATKGPITATAIGTGAV